MATLSKHIPPGYVNVPSSIVYGDLPDPVCRTYARLRGLAWQSRYRETMPISVAELAELFGCTERSVWGHLRVLRDAGLVTWNTCSGRMVFVFDQVEHEPYATDAPPPACVSLGDRVTEADAVDPHVGMPMAEPVAEPVAEPDDPRVREADMMWAAALREFELQTLPSVYSTAFLGTSVARCDDGTIVVRCSPIGLYALERLRPLIERTLGRIGNNGAVAVRFEAMVPVP